MYNLPHFKAGNQNEVMAFMQEHPFITLCGCGTDALPVATHIPVLIVEKDTKIYLHGHVMRGQTHTEAFAQNENVLAIFSGAHTYVSASWYKQQNIASTWNYSAVHAQGKLIYQGEAELYKLLVNLTNQFEGEHSPSLVKHMKPGYVSSLMQHIVAFEIEVTKLEHVFKLSQNRDEQSYASIIQHLHEQNNPDANIIATAMQERQPT